MSQAAPSVDAGLWLYFRGGERVLTVSAERVQRALLIEEAEAPRWPEPSAAARAPLGCLGVLAVADGRFVAWDLGTLLGSAPARRSWILARVGAPEAPVAMALRADECLHVGGLSREGALALPAGAVRARPAFPAVLWASARRAGRDQGGIVLELDLERLWTEEERAFSRQLLEAAADGAAQGEHA